LGLSTLNGVVFRNPLSYEFLFAGVQVFEGHDWFFFVAITANTKERRQKEEGKED